MHKHNVRLVASFLLVSAITFVVFSPTLQHDFLRYDDEIYVYENPYIRSLRWENIAWMFTNPYFKSYTPIALLSHSVDYAVYGFDPRGHHLTNVLLHAVNACWVFLLAVAVLSLLRIRAGSEGIFHHIRTHTDGAVLVGGFLAALAFALHPLKVESVAWISDRKDLLLGFFILPSMLCYLEYAFLRGTPHASRWRSASLLFFLLALLSKTIAVMMPAVLIAADMLLLDSFTGWRKRLRELIVEKLPYFVLSGLFLVFSTLAAKGEKVSFIIQELEPLQKALLPLYSPTFYLFKFLWPHPLVPVYLAPGQLEVIAYAIVTLIILVVSLRLAKSGKNGLLLGLGFFVIFLLPTILGQSAGIQPWADRYTYLPSVGLVMLLGWWMMKLWDTGRAVVAIRSAVVVLGIWTLVSLQQIPKWSDSITLWKHAVQAASEPSILTIVPLGVAYYHADHLDSALACYAKAIQLEPDSRYALFNAAVAHEKMGNVDKAIIAYEAIARGDTAYYPAQNNLANLYAEQNEPEKAITLYELMIKRGFANADAYYNLAVALEKQGRVEEATRMYHEALKIVPGHPQTHANLGSLALRSGKPQEAVEILRRGLNFDGRDAVLHYNLGVAQEITGDSSAAIISYTRAIQLKPGYIAPYINLGNLYMHTGLAGNAAVVFSKAIQAGGDSSSVFFGYGVATEALGNAPEALEAYKTAIERDSSNIAAYINMGNLFARSGKLEEAERVYLAALATGRDSAEVAGNLAVIRAALKSAKK